MAKKLLIYGGRVINPKTNTDSFMDILISGNKIENIDSSIEKSENYDLLDANNCIVSPGFIDIHCHLREPGEEYKETVVSAGHLFKKILKKNKITIYPLDSEHYSIWTLFK